MALKKLEYLCPVRSWLYTAFLMVSFTLGLNAQPSGYSFSKQITIDSAQVPGTSNLTDFPLLFSVVDTNLRHVDAGGSVRNPNGYDIIFTEGDCNSLLKHQIEEYDSASGSLVAWVQLTSLSAIQNSVIYMFYGNNSINTNPSTDSTFNSNYLAVYHLNQNFSDASINNYTGTNNGSTNNASSKIGAGRSFVDPNHWIELTTLPDFTGSFTISAWINTSDNTRAGQRIICDDEGNANGGYALSLGDPGTGRLRFYIRGLGVTILDSPSNAISNGTWYHTVGVFDQSTNTKRIFINGTQVASRVEGGTFTSSDPGDASIGGETASGESSNRFNGSIDEARFQTVARSANWIRTEFNNQNNPSSFYSIGSQQNANPCTPLSLNWIQFNVDQQNEAVVAICNYLSSRNPKSIRLERSNDLFNWKELSDYYSEFSNGKISFKDKPEESGLYYYRVHFEWMDGTSEYSEIRAISFEVEEKQNIYFNREEQSLIIRGLDLNTERIQILNLLGQELIVNPMKTDSKDYKVDLKGHSADYIIVRTSKSNYRFIR